MQKRHNSGALVMELRDVSFALNHRYVIFHYNRPCYKEFPLNWYFFSISTCEGSINSILFKVWWCMLIGWLMGVKSNLTALQFRADSRLAPSQWETLLQCNTVSHWLGANLESTLYLIMTAPLWGAVQERRNSIANALELRLSCTDPSIWALLVWNMAQLGIIIDWSVMTWYYIQNVTLA